MTNGRDDVAVLHDMRVAPSHQRRGIGKRLFETVSEWARNEGMRYLKIETQNTNVPACRFYQKMGARLGGLERHAYAGANSEEVMLLWYLEL
jgi:GNAT superfamily N-acetyltransferase